VPELAVYVVSGEVELGSHRLGDGVMAVLSPGREAEIQARSDACLMVLGGAPVGPRELWWNFVAPSFDRIERAKDDWKAGRFARIAGDDEFIPLPD
jgi:hypothetical protein